MDLARFDVLFVLYEKTQTAHNEYGLGNARFQYRTLSQGTNGIRSRSYLFHLSTWLPLIYYAKSIDKFIAYWSTGSYNNDVTRFSRFLTISIHWPHISQTYNLASPVLSNHHYSISYVDVIFTRTSFRVHSRLTSPLDMFAIKCRLLVITDNSCVAPNLSYAYPFILRRFFRTGY